MGFNSAFKGLIKPHKVSDYTLVKSYNTIMKTCIKETKMQTKKNDTLFAIFIILWEINKITEIASYWYD